MTSSSPLASQARYFTTPIFYASGKPHAGHVYACTLLDVVCRHYRCRGATVVGLTGMDEHGEKIEEKAAAANTSPQQFVDTLAAEWQAVWKSFGFQYDVFLRTSQPEHQATVRELLNRCHAAGDIYAATHTGQYCVDCEAFLTPKEMDEHNLCLIHKRPTETRSEENYYFRTTKYRAEILKRVRAGELVAQPRYQAELAQLLEDLDGDLSISRPKSRTKWGIELPFDPAHIAYVWFDALSNYLTGVGGVAAAETSPLWKNAVHIIGKDILRFHGIYWPAILLSAGLPLPRLCVTGFLLQQGHKMSKSLGNVFTVEEISSLGRDAFANMVLRVCNPGEDLEISQSLGIEKFNAELANGIGNLASRTLTMVEKYENSVFPNLLPAETTAHALGENQLRASGNLDSHGEIIDFLKALPTNVETAFDTFKPADALQEMSKLVSLCDKLIAAEKPWELAKRGEAAKITSLLGVSVACLRQIGFLAYPIFPEKMAELLRALGEDVSQEGTFAARAHNYAASFDGRKLLQIPRLFQRMEAAKMAVETTSKGAAKTVAETPSRAPANDVLKRAVSQQTVSQQGAPQQAAPADVFISIDDFAKVELRVGTVLNAEIVEGSDKLLRLKVSLGNLGVREILSGIRAWVKPEELVNHKVLVVSNLAPRKMKFGTSAGMLLATEGDDGVFKPVFVADSLKEGARLS